MGSAWPRSLLAGSTVAVSRVLCYADFDGISMSGLWHDTCDDTNVDRAFCPIVSDASDGVALAGTWRLFLHLQICVREKSKGKHCYCSSTVPDYDGFVYLPHGYAFSASGTNDLYTDRT